MSFLTGPRLLRGPADCPPAPNAGGRLVLPALVPVEFSKHARHDRRRPRLGIGQQQRITGEFRLGRSFRYGLVRRPARYRRSFPYRRLFRYRCVVPFAARTRVHARSIHPDPHSPMHALLPHQLQDPNPAGGAGSRPVPAHSRARVNPDRSINSGAAAGNRELPLDIGDAATADFPEANPTELTAPASVTASVPASLDLHPRGVEPIHSGRCAPERCSGHGTGALRAVTD